MRYLLAWAKLGVFGVSFDITNFYMHHFWIKDFFFFWLSHVPVMHDHHLCSALPKNLFPVLFEILKTKSERFLRTCHKADNLILVKYHKDIVRDGFLSLEDTSSEWMKRKINAALAWFEKLSLFLRRRKCKKTYKTRS